MLCEDRLVGSLLEERYGTASSGLKAAPRYID